VPLPRIPFPEDGVPNTESSISQFGPAEPPSQKVLLQYDIAI